MAAGMSPYSCIFENCFLGLIVEWSELPNFDDQKRVAHWARVSFHASFCNDGKAMARRP